MDLESWKVWTSLASSVLTVFEKVQKLFTGKKKAGVEQGKTIEPVKVDDPSTGTGALIVEAEIVEVENELSPRRIMRSLEKLQPFYQEGAKKEFVGVEVEWEVYYNSMAKASNYGKGKNDIWEVSCKPRKDLLDPGIYFKVNIKKHGYFIDMKPWKKLKISGTIEEIAIRSFFVIKLKKLEILE